MSAPDLTPELMKKFRASGAERHSTILLGAGASTASGLPNWDTFATRLLVNSGAVGTEGTAQLLLSRQDPLIVVEAARVAFGESWERELRSSLYAGVDTLTPSPLHLATIGHFLSGDPVDTSLVTLNFDTLLEQSYEEATACTLERHSDGGSVENIEAVHHLHGVISPNATENVVLTLRDYTNLIANSDSWQHQYLRAAIAKGALIIAGTSYRDPDLRQWLHSALKDKPTEHSALVLLAREGFSVSKEEFGLIQGALSDQWSAVGLEPILLQDHSDAAQIIHELRHIHEEGYTSPQERSHAVWDAHANDFSALKTAYVQQLHEDSERLKDALNTDEINLSLWLANGEQLLMRWAAQDRTYRDISSLRSVETGHDSPWIAGQALGADQILFKDLDSNDRGRWSSVLAVPIPTPHPRFPAHSTAVLTIGLPQLVTVFKESQILWLSLLVEIASEWGTRIGHIAFEEQED